MISWAVVGWKERWGPGALQERAGQDRQDGVGSAIARPSGPSGEFNFAQLFFLHYGTQASCWWASAATLPPVVHVGPGALTLAVPI